MRAAGLAVGARPVSGACADAGFTPSICAESRWVHRSAADGAAGGGAALAAAGRWHARGSRIRCARPMRRRRPSIRRWSSVSGLAPTQDSQRCKASLHAVERVPRAFDSPPPGRHDPPAAMRIHLISPTHYLRDGSLHKTTRYWTSAITLPYLKALTPRRHRVAFTDELMADLDLGRVEHEADVVGITAMGPQIRRAYDLADYFRTRGKKVVLGGTWVSLVPEESLRHADAVVAGEAENVWADVLADLETGRSRGIYRAAGWHDLRN